MSGDLVLRMEADDKTIIQIEETGPGARQPFRVAQYSVRKIHKDSPETQEIRLTFSLFQSLDQAIDSASSLLARKSVEYREAVDAAQRVLVDQGGLYELGIRGEIPIEVLQRVREEIR